MSGSNSNLAVIDRVPAPPTPTAPVPGGPPAQVQPASPRPLTDDDLELQAAHAALAAEEAARAAGTPATPPAATPPASAPAAAPEPARPEIMVTKARLDEMAADRNRWRDAAMYEKGAREAAEAAAGAPPAPATPPAPPAEDRDVIALQQVEVDWNKLWADYDNGSIVGTELGAKLIPLLSATIGLNMNRVLIEVDRHVKALLANLPAPVGAVDAIMIEQQKAKLYHEHPWALAVNNDEGRFLTDMAMREFKALGVVIEKGPVGQMKLTQRVAELATFYMPQWHPGEEPPKTPTQPAAAAPPAAIVPATPPGPVPAFRAPARRHVEEAMARQANLPPTAPGAAGNAAGRIDLARVDTMTDEELENLPPEERQRLLLEVAPS